MASEMADLLILGTRQCGPSVLALQFACCMRTATYTACASVCSAVYVGIRLTLESCHEDSVNYLHNPRMSFLTYSNSMIIQENQKVSQYSR